MPILSKKNRELYEEDQEPLYTLTVRVPGEVHKALIELAKIMLMNKPRPFNLKNSKETIEKEFTKWKDQTEVGREIKFQAMNIATQTNYLAAQKYMKDRFFEANPHLKTAKNNKNTSPTGYSRDDLGRVLTDALDMSKTKLKNKYMRG